MRTNKGQALMIAVLLMTVILLVGAIFVAIVVYVQTQSTRHGESRQAKALADGGIQFADRMLRRKTADWRPDNPPAWCTGPGGQFDSVEAVIDPNYAGDDQFDPGFWGPDAKRQTDDDYDTVEELRRGWCERRKGNALPGDPAANAPQDAAGNPLYPDRNRLDEAGELVTRGFTRYPDPRRATPAGQDLPVSVNNGHVLLRLTYDPDPPFENTPDEDRNHDGNVDWQDADPLSCMIRIESAGAVVSQGFVYRMLVAYKPLGITDYVRWVTDRSGTGQPVYFGVPSWIDFDADQTDPAVTTPTDLSEHFLTRLVGPVRVDSSLVLVGEQLGGPLASTQFEVTTESGPDAGQPSGSRNSAYLRRDDVVAANGISYRDRASDASIARQATVLVKADPGTVNAPEPIWPTTSQASFDQPFDTWGDQTGDKGPAVADGQKTLDANGFSRFASPRSAPRLFERDPDTGHTLYEDLTRYTGALQAVTQNGSTYYVHAGEWGHGDALYIDNVSDRQFIGSNGECDIQTLMDDWLRNISPTDARAGDSGWNAARTTYSPVGVEIWIVGRELGAAYDANNNPNGVYVVQSDPRNPPLPPGRLWAVDHATGEPQIVLRRYDHTWRTATGADSGQFVRVIDHPRRTSPNDPPKQVIYAAGNVRVKGVLPPRPPEPTTAPTAPKEAASVFYPDYNLTIVSGGTAYIDGSILSPRDAGLGTIGAGEADDDRNTKLAILARDCVCLNTTQIVPQEATAGVSAEPDDTDNPRPEDSHWELTSEPGARVHSSFMFGEQPPAGATLRLAAVMCAKDPGPSAVSMSFYPGPVAATPAWVPYVFDATQTNPTPPPALLPAAYLFYFLQPGAAAAPNVSTALSPRYQPIFDPSGNPTTPWSLIENYLVPDPNNAGRLQQGVWNDFVLSWANPNMGAGATSTWIKRWKIMEFHPDPNNAGLVIPAPAVHCHVNGVMYAEQGCWFVIPGANFMTAQEIDREVGPPQHTVNGRIDTAMERNRAVRQLRYNYDITVNGMITENFTAPVDVVRDWTDKWSYPGSGPSGSLPSIAYNFDSSVRAARDYGAGGAGVVGAGKLLRSTDSANLPRLPLLPVCPDLVYYGETM
jgi:hypothetical protein